MIDRDRQLHEDLQAMRVRLLDVMRDMCIEDRGKYATVIDALNTSEAHLWNAQDELVRMKW